jgi:putative glutamine amidotransferase
LKEGNQTLSNVDTTADGLDLRGYRPSIAISAPKPRNRDCARVPVDYIDAVRRAGGTSRVLGSHHICHGEPGVDGVDVHGGLGPEDAVALAPASGLILTGGGDVDPAFYGQSPHPRTYNVSPRRDRFEFALLDEALARDMPVLAICRGMQLLNVHLGGTLEQHLLDRSGRLEHDRDRTRAEPAHDIHVRPGTWLADWLGERAPVNSHHHQGLGVVADCLQEAARAEDGVLEAVTSHAHSWVVAVQWHPEAMVPLDERQLAMFRALVDAAARFDRVSARSRSA